MGLYHGSHAGVDFIEGCGATAGYRHNMALIPEMGLGLVVLTSSKEGNELSAAIKLWAIRRYLGLETDSVLEA